MPSTVIFFSCSQSTQDMETNVTHNQSERKESPDPPSTNSEMEQEESWLSLSKFSMNMTSIVKRLSGQSKMN